MDAALIERSCVCNHLVASSARNDKEPREALAMGAAVVIFKGERGPHSAQDSRFASSMPIDRCLNQLRLASAPITGSSEVGGSTSPMSSLAIRHVRSVTVAQTFVPFQPLLRPKVTDGFACGDREIPVARACGSHRVSMLLKEFCEDQRFVDHFATERCSKGN